MGSCCRIGFNFRSSLLDAGRERPLCDSLIRASASPAPSHASLRCLQFGAVRHRISVHIIIGIGAKLLRQAHFPHQLSKPWVGTYRVQ